MGDTNTTGWKKVENPVKGRTAVADKPQEDTAAAQAAAEETSAAAPNEVAAVSTPEKVQGGKTANRTGTKKTAARKPRVKAEDTAPQMDKIDLSDAAPMQDDIAPSSVEKAADTEILLSLPDETASPDQVLPQAETTPATAPSKAAAVGKRTSTRKSAPPSTDEPAGTKADTDTSLIPADGEKGLALQEEPSAGWKQVGIIPAVPEEGMDGEDTPVIRAPYDYVKKPRRKRRYRFAAPLGLLVILLAATGVISLVVMGVQAIQRSQDDTDLRTELMDFLEPVVQYMPSPFEDVNDNPQEALLLGAIWRVTDEERIRMLREKDDVSRYPTDDLGRMEIPVSKILDAYAALFGKDAQPSLVTIGDPGLSFTFEYDSANGIYHVPYTSASTSYVPVLDTLKHKGSSYTLRIGYVPNNDIGVDEKGNPVDPLPEQADYFLIYHVEKEGDGWRLVSVSADK